MKFSSILVLKAIVLLFGISVLVMCLLITNVLITENVGMYRPVLIGMLVASLPFFFGLYQTIILLNIIDQKKVYTLVSVKVLNNIKYCGIIICALYSVSLPYIYLVAERDDAPGAVLLGSIFTFAPLVVAVFAAVFQNLLQNAIDLKKENELTV